MTGIIKEMRRIVTELVDDEKKAGDIVYALIKNFGGDRLYIPTNDYQMRNREIEQMFKSGITVTMLASRYHLSEKTIYRILKHRKVKVI